jgi:hypothetical protein
MDRELAQMVIMSTSRARMELGNLMPLLKMHGENEKDERARLAIANAIYEIGLVADSIFEQYPDLKIEFEARASKYGRSYY